MYFSFVSEVWVTLTAIVGNPKPRSRTLHAAELVAAALTGSAPDVTVDLAELGAELLDWSSAPVTAAKSAVKSSEVVVVATPTYKGSYSGLLKLFLDRFGAGELVGLTAVPVMLGGDPRHSLAVEAFLKPVLAEIGASCPTRGLFLVDAIYDDPGVIESWAKVARQQISFAEGVA